MPNHITNYLTIFGTKEKTDEILNTIRSKDRIIDFNKIIPMPKELRYVSSPPKIVSESEYKEAMIKFKESLKNPSDFEKIVGVSHPITAEMSEDYLERFGANDWYNWAIKHWGTKWNSYDNREAGTLPTNADIFETKIHFHTAWSTPFPVIQQLSSMFKETVFLLEYYDEDIGSNTGKVTLLGGMISNMIIPENGSDEAYALITQIDPDMRDYIHEILNFKDEEE